MADYNGNTIANVHVEHDGYAAINTAALVPPTLAELQSETIPANYNFLGLLVNGYNEDVATGDTLPMWSPDYDMQNGTYSVGGKIVAAEDNIYVKSITGYVSAGGSALSRSYTHFLQSFGLITATVDQHGKATIRGGMAKVTGVSPSYGARGEIDNVEIQFEWLYIDNQYYLEAVRDFSCVPSSDGSGDVFTLFLLNPVMILRNGATKIGEHEYMLPPRASVLLSDSINVTAGERFRFLIEGVFQGGQTPSLYVGDVQEGVIEGTGSFVTESVYVIDYSIQGTDTTSVKFGVYNSSSASFILSSFKVYRIN